MTDASHAPNHHSHYPGFAGIHGLVGALSMLGRESDAVLATRLAQLGPNDTVVDVGCGPGTAARHAARVATSVVGVDPAPIMLRVAKLVPRRGNNLRFVAGTAEALPVGDDTASVLWSIACVHHWHDIDTGLKEANRVLEPGGRFVAIERHTEPGAQGLRSHGWTDDRAAAFAEQCRAHGFADVHVETQQAKQRSTIAVVGVCAKN
jgi:ubiquinone/menaquinone biosynthesis C-methylase UbiE